MNSLSENIRSITDIKMYSCQYPDMIFGPDGKIYACWQQYCDKKDTVIVSQIDGESIIRDGISVSSDGQALQPRLYLFDGEIWVFWSECLGGRWKLLARTFGTDRSLGDIITLSESAGAFYPCITSDSKSMYIAWTAQESGDSRTMFITFDGKTISDEFQISDTLQAYRPVIAFGGDGNLYAAYDVYNGSQYTMNAKVLCNGSWSSEKVISETTDWAALASILPTDKGVTVVWHDVAPRSDTNYWSAELSSKDSQVCVDDIYNIVKLRVWYAGAHLAKNSKGTEIMVQGQSLRMLTCRHRTAGGRWEKPVIIASDEKSNCYLRPRVLVDENDMIYVIFQYSNGNGHYERLSDIRFMKYSFADLTSRDDSEVDKRIEDFTRPTPKEKILSRIEPDIKRAWLDENGYIGLDVKFGDIHGQSGMSDGSGQIDQYYNYAKTIPKLDFTSLTDHDAFPDVITETEWELMRTTSNEFNKDGELTTLLSYEWTPNEGRYDFGHKNVYYRGNDGELFRSTELDGMTPDRLYGSIKKYGGLCIPHHPAADWGLVSAATDWDFHDPEVERAVEIFSRHAPFEKHGTTSPYTKNVNRMKGKYTQDGLARGYRMGFTAGSDSHQVEHGTEGGIVAAYVPSPNRANIFDAIYNRFTYATTGTGILVSLKVNGARMGSEITITKGQTVKIDVDVLGTGDISSVEIIKNNVDIHSEKSSNDRCKFTITDTDLEKGTTYYYIRVTQKDEHMAWSSPIWVDVI